MVLFVFIIMLLNLGAETAEQERKWLKPKIWIGPSALAFILLIELTYLILSAETTQYTSRVVEPKEVAVSVFSAYIIGVELAAMLLMAGVVGAAHIGQHKKVVLHRFLQEGSVS